MPGSHALPTRVGGPGRHIRRSSHAVEAQRDVRRGPMSTAGTGRRMTTLEGGTPPRSPAAFVRGQLAIAPGYMALFACAAIPTPLGAIAAALAGPAAAVAAPAAG